MILEAKTWQTHSTVKTICDGTSCVFIETVATETNYKLVSYRIDIVYDNLLCSEELTSGAHIMMVR